MRLNPAWLAPTLLGVAILSLAACAAPMHEARPAPTITSGTPADGRPDACPAVPPILRRSAQLFFDYQARVTGDGTSLAGNLSALHGLEEAFAAATSDLRSGRFTDRENARDAAIAVGELDQARGALGTVRSTIEGAARQVAVPLREAREKAWEMRTLCEASRRPSADCRRVMKAFPDTELASWTSGDAIDRASAKLARFSPRDPGMAAELGVVKTKLAAASTGITELAELDLEAAERDVLAHTRPGMAALVRIDERCGDAAKLRPVDWASAPDGTDPRRLTVLVVGVLPEPMRKVFDADESKGDLATGSMGSGVVVVRRTRDGRGTRTRAFVVTNRHVVDHAQRTKIGRDGTRDLLDAEVVHVDPHHDLAVLEVVPDANGRGPFERGVALETTPAADQQTVIAAGFPGMAGAPSYQVTRGYVSNRRVRLNDGDLSTYVQHTAPTDPGSSGGPLLSERGRLIGINTLKIRGREGVAFAVPADLVVEALRAAESRPVRAEASRGARLACLAILADLGAGARLDRARRRLSAEFVAEVGPPTLARTTKRMSADEQRAASFAYHRDPLGVLDWVALTRLQESLAASGGVSELEMCDGVTMSGASGGEPSLARFLIQTVKGPRELKLVRERGEWTVASFDFRDLPRDPPAKVKARPKANAKASRSLR